MSDENVVIPPPPLPPAPPPLPPPSLLPPPPPPPPVPMVATTRWRSLRGLTTALTVLLYLAAAGAVFSVVAYVSRIGALSDIIDGTLNGDRIQRAHDADDLVSAAVTITVLLALAILVLIVIWTYRAAKNNDALGRIYPRFKPAWAIAGWLVPLVNLVIPVLILQDLWRGSDTASPREDPGWRANKGSSLIGWYWAVFLVSSLRYGVGTSEAHLLDTNELRDLRNHDRVALVGMVASIGAAVLAVQVIRRITTRQENCLRAQQAAWAALPAS